MCPHQNSFLDPPLFPSEKEGTKKKRKKVCVIRLDWIHRSWKEQRRLIRRMSSWRRDGLISLMERRKTMLAEQSSGSNPL